MWEEVVEKAIDIKEKASLQPPSKIKEIDSKCPKDYKPSIKKDKDKVTQKYWNRDKNKAKSNNPPFTNSQFQI